MIDAMGKRHDRFAGGLRDLIIECSRSGELIELHAVFQKDDRFYCGRVVEVEEDQFRLEYVDPLGAPGSDGILDAWLGFDEVGFIRRNTAYLRGLRKLIPVHDRFISMPKGKFRRKLAGIRKLIKDAAGTQSVVTITVEDSNHSVKVLRADGFALFGTRHDDDGALLDEWAVRFDQICRVRRGSYEAAMDWLIEQSLQSST
jgi:hypothetical protein